MMKKAVRWGLIASIGLLAGGAASPARADDHGTSAHDSSGVRGDLEQAGDTVGSAVTGAAKTTGNAVENAGQAVGHATKEAGQASSKAAQKSGQATGDAAVTSHVKQELATHEPDASDVDVDTKHGVVTLSGTVQSRDVRERAVHLARGTDGVTKVKDHLKVNRNP